MMTKKHYKRIAEIIKNSNIDEETLTQFIIYFKEDNPNFNEVKFREAVKLIV